MGHKVNPIGLRLGINRTWDSRWFAGRDYARLLHEDLKLRTHLRTKLSGAGISRVVIERPAKKPRITIYAARPGVVIGKKGQDIEHLRRELGTMSKADVTLNIVEIRKPEIDAVLVAENIAQQLERRVAFPPGDEARGAVGDAPGCTGHPDQRAAAASAAPRSPAWSGIAKGRVPLAHAACGHRFRRIATAKTTYGTCGVKVWIFKGEILKDTTRMSQDRRAAEQASKSVILKR